MADKKISELDQALQINNDAVFPISQDNGGTDTTYKVSITQISAEIGEDQTFSNLDTTDKTLVGAINEIAQGGGGTTDYEDLSNKPQVNSVELVGNTSLDDLGIMPASLSKTVSGSIAHITDGGDNIPVKSLTSQIVAVESGNGQPKSPTNPYTISGFNSGIVSVCGVNLWNEQWENGLYYVNGSEGANSNCIRTVNFINVKPNTIYSMVTGTSAYFRIVYYDINKTVINTSTIANVGNVSYTIPNNCYYIKFCSLPDSSPIYGGTYNNDISINYPSSDTDYHAYNGTTYTFTFGQTVYGGYFDNKGNLVVTHRYAKGFTTSNVGTTPSGLKYCDVSLSGLVRNAIAVSNIYEWKNADTTSADNSFKTFTNVITFYDSRFTDVATANTILADVEVVYALATPITLAITSQNIPTLLGENNIFSNCGDVEVEYFTEKANAIAELIKAFM